MTTRIEPVLKLVTELLRKTEANQVKWTLTDVETVFSLNLPRGGVTIGRNPNYGTVRFSVYDPGGQEVEAFTTSSMGASDPEEALLENLLNDLYEIARRAALNSDQVIHNILEDL